RGTRFCDGAHTVTALDELVTEMRADEAVGTRHCDQQFKPSTNADLSMRGRARGATKREDCAPTRRRTPPMPLCCAALAMLKNYVLDTNVLLHDPGAIYRFEENQVVVPI